MYADYFTTLCRTEDDGMVLLLIERDEETVETRPIKTSYSAAAGTAYVSVGDFVKCCLTQTVPLI